MTRRTESFTVTEAEYVLWHWGLPGGVPPGGFMEALLNAWGRADNENWARLAKGFPELAAAFELGMGLNGWKLQFIVAEDRDCTVEELT